MIVSNFFYIDVVDLYFVEGDVCFELLMVLVVGDQGLVDLVYIICEGWQYLQFGGWMLLEYGWIQGEVVCVLFCEVGYLDVVICCDYGDNECLIFGCLFDMENVG